MATFDLELVSPERLLLSRPVEMAVIPAVEGDMGVLPNHAPMIVALKGGLIRVTEGGQETERLFIMGGFAEITPTRVTVLADEATPVASLSKSAAAQRVAEAEVALTAAANDAPEVREKAADRLMAARAMQDAAQAA